MSYGSRGGRERWRQFKRAERILGTTLGASCAAIGVVACGGSSGGHAATRGSANGPSAVAYSACMRRHGVPKYPDPDSSGALPKVGLQQLGVSGSQFHSAVIACASLLPTTASLQQQEHQCMQNSNCPRALVQQMLGADVRLARCMRSHGVPNFPDPTLTSQGPIFNITKAGISDAASHTQGFIGKLNECGRLVRDNAPESFE